MTGNNKLKTYSALAVSFIAFQKEVNAQVIYVDIDPDVIIDTVGENYLLDIDDNIQNEFNFSYGNLTWDSNIYKFLFVSAYEHLSRKNEVAGFDTVLNYLGIHYAFGFSQSQLISENLSQAGTERELEFIDEHFMNLVLKNYSAGGGSIYGGVYYWTDDTGDLFLGFRFDNPENQHFYGWIRCDVYNNGKALSIKDFAYEQQPGVPIIAGSTESYVPVNENENILQANVYAFNKNIYILCQLSNTAVHIYDMPGKTIHASNLSAETITIPVQTQGVYIVEMVNGNSTFRKKISIY